MSQRRFTEAEIIFKKIANMNGKVLTTSVQMKEDTFDLKAQDEENNFSKQLESDAALVKTENTDMKTMMKLLCFPIMNFKKSFLLSCVWFSLNLLYYGVGLGITSIDAINPYLMYIFSSFAELCGYLLCAINDKIGRRRSSILFFTLSGIICLIISFVPRNKNLMDNKKIIIDATIIIILVSIGKCMASAAFNTCYVFTAEFYPTKVRNFALLFISCIGNVGGFISPQVNYSKVVWKSLPYVIFSSFSLLGSLSVFLLPKIKKIIPTDNAYDEVHL